jgi:uncharacterized membrane protein (DUF485 family)
MDYKNICMNFSFYTVKEKPPLFSTLITQIFLAIFTNIIVFITWE